MVGFHHLVGVEIGSFSKKLAVKSQTVDQTIIIAHLVVLIYIFLSSYLEGKTKVEFLAWLTSFCLEIKCINAVTTLVRSVCMCKFLLAMPVIPTLMMMVLWQPFYRFCGKLAFQSYFETLRLDFKAIQEF